ALDGDDCTPHSPLRVSSNGLRLSGARRTPPSDPHSPRTVCSDTAARVRCSRGLGDRTVSPPYERGQDRERDRYENTVGDGVGKAGSRRTGDDRIARPGDDRKVEGVDHASHQRCVWRRRRWRLYHGDESRNDHVSEEQRDRKVRQEYYYHQATEGNDLHATCLH